MAIRPARADAWRANGCYGRSVDAGIVIRRIRAHEGPLLRELRIRSLSDSPEAFGRTVDEAATRSASDWDAQARSSSAGHHRAWFFAEVDGVTVGVVQARRRSPHDALIFSMWVEPAYRRMDVGRLLIGEVERWARGWGSRRLVLWVFAQNDAAIRFYDHLGFRTVSDGADADSGRAYGALAMSLATGSVIGAASAGVGGGDPGSDGGGGASGSGGGGGASGSGGGGGASGAG